MFVSLCCCGAAFGDKEGDLTALPEHAAQTLESKLVALGFSQAKVKRVVQDCASYLDGSGRYDVNSAVKHFWSQGGWQNLDVERDSKLLSRYYSTAEIRQLECMLKINETSGAESSGLGLETCGDDDDAAAFGITPVQQVVCPRLRVNSVLQQWIGDFAESLDEGGDQTTDAFGAWKVAKLLNGKTMALMGDSQIEQIASSFLLLLKRGVQPSSVRMQVNTACFNSSETVWKSCAEEKEIPGSRQLSKRDVFGRGHSNLTVEEEEASAARRRLTFYKVETAFNEYYVNSSHFSFCLRVYVPYLYQTHVLGGPAGFLAEDVDVAVASFGAHYLGDGSSKMGREMYEKHMQRLLLHMGNWQSRRKTTRVAIFAEVPVSHFPEKSDGSYTPWYSNSTNRAAIFDLEGDHFCQPLPAPALQHASRWQSDVIRSKLARWNLDGKVKFGRSRGRVHFLPTHDYLATRWDAHPESNVDLEGKTKLKQSDGDCTHFCWIPAIWQPFWTRLGVLLLFTWP